MAGAANPYYDPHEDDDLFNPRAASLPNDGKRHALDGSKCWCGETHDVKLPDNIPDEVLEELSKFLDRLPDKAVEIIVTAENSLSIKLLRDFIGFANMMDEVNQHGPLLRAMAEVIDEQVGGNKIGPLTKFYEAEQAIISTHVMLKTVNSLRDSIQADITEENAERFGNLIEVVDKIIGTTLLRLEKTVERYRSIGAETGHTVDQTIIDSGIYSDDAPYFATRLISIPILRRSKAGEDEDEDDSSE